MPVAYKVVPRHSCRYDSRLTGSQYLPLLLSFFPDNHEKQEYETLLIALGGAERLPLRIREDSLLIGQIFRYGRSMIETAGRDILDLWP